MKKLNLLVMSLVSAAALSFTSCSSNDDLTGNAGQDKVGEFYMTLTVQTPTANGTRTVVKDPTLEATTEESNVTSGTFYLVDANGNVAFKKTLSANEWNEAKAPTQGQNGKTTLNIPVENVSTGATYTVYFLANTTDETPWSSVYTAGNKFAGEYAKADNFVMFNQNDNSVKGNSHTVTFTAANKDSKTPASVGTIQIERATARIDQPTSKVSKIVAYEKEDATDAEKKAMADAVAKVESLNLTGYAISNLSNKTNIMQQWDNAFTTLTMPTDYKYFQATKEFGTETLLENPDFFNHDTKLTSNVDYVFENNPANQGEETAMYFEYTVKLKDNAGTQKDFEDGTFYRYNNVIYTSFADIFKAYNDVQGLFNGKSAEALASELKAAKEDANAEAKLDEFRRTYDIEVFNAGKTYYKQEIKDKNLNAYIIQRNTIYRLTVNNIFNVGAQVPNGKTDKNGLYYLDVEVSVNPWVLSDQDVDLK